MLNRLLGKSNGGEDSSRSQSTRRRHSRRGSDSITKSSESRDKERHREDRRREDGEHTRSRKERNTEERSRSRDRGDTKRERRTKRDKKDKDPTDNKNLDKSMDGYDEGIARGPLGGNVSFSEQVGSSGFAQFPGQYNPSGFVGGPPAPSVGLSDRIPDQFPGQFPLNSTAPYRPPLSANQGGLGLAADYYGDAGQSVAQQPGVRPQLPPVGAPQIQTAAPPAGPPPRPGAAGAAAPFFNGGINSDIGQASLSNTSTMNNVSSAYQQPYMSDPIATYPPGSNKPDKKYHSSSTPIVATLGAVAAGAAVGYTMSNSSHQHESGIASNLGESGQSEFASSSHQRPTHSHEYHDSASGSVQTSRPAKYSQQPSRLPLYAAGAIGAAGMAASASHHNDHNNSAPPYQTSLVTQRHRHRGPLNLLVDFFKDPEGVAEFEEYTEYIGVCKDCFAPGSSPRDAPRKHHYRYRPSKERRNGGSRIDKDNRYWSSDGENQRKKKGSWLTTAIAGYGVAKIGEKLFNQSYGRNDTYTVNSGRVQRSQTSTSGHRSSFSPDRKNYNSHIATSNFSAHQRKRSIERAGTGFVGNGKESKNDRHGQVSGGPSMITHESRHHSRLRSRSRSRSKSRDRKSGLIEGMIGAAIATSVLSSNSRRRSRSPRGAHAKSKHKTRGGSPDQKPSSDQRKYANDQRSRRSPTNHSDRRASQRKKTRFFNFSVESSSTEEIIKSDDSSERRRAYRAKAKEQGKTDAALAIAGAAILASNKRRQEDKPLRGGELVAVKESRPSQARKPGSDAKIKNRVSWSGLDEGRRASASEDEYVSADSNLAYGGGGGARRRGSQESLSSDSSGMSKWGWRWGSKKSRGEKGQKKTTTSVVDAGQPSSEIMRVEEVPLQHIIPLSTSDQYQFEVALQGSAGLSRQSSTPSRPAAAPIQHHQTPAPSIQHPQPIAPLPTTVYDAQPLYVHSYSDPTGYQVLPEMQHQPQYSVFPSQPENYANLPQNTILYSYPQHQEASNAPSYDIRTSKPRRSNTSPTISSTQLLSDQNGSSAVPFELVAEQLELDRQENHRRRRESKISQSTHQRQEADDYDPRVKGDGIPKTGARKLPANEMMPQERFRSDDAVVPAAIEIKPQEVPSWKIPVAIGGIGTSISRVAKSGNSDSNFAQEAHIDLNEHKYPEGAFITEVRQASPEPIEEPIAVAAGERGSGQEKPVSVWQAAAQTSRRNSSHEDYATFFAPPELQSNITDQRQAASDNAGDIASSGAPEIITIEPKGFHESSHSPAYSFSYSGDEGDTSPLPWVPKLNFIAPTPILSRSGSIDRGSTPVGDLDKAADNSESPQPTTGSKVTWGEHETIEYTVITPMDQPGQFIDSSSQVHADEADVTMDRDKGKNADNPLPNDVAESHHVPQYGDDVEFAACLAAGLEKSGFDPSIVIDDPSFRQHESPTRSEKPSNQLESASSAVNEPKFHSPTHQPPYSPGANLVDEDVLSVAMPGAFGEETPVIEANEREKELRDTHFEGKNPHEAYPRNYGEGGIDEFNTFPQKTAVPNSGLDESLENITSTSGNIGSGEDVFRIGVSPVANLNSQRQVISSIPASLDDSAETNDGSSRYPQTTVAKLTRDVDPTVHGSSPEADYEGDKLKNSQLLERLDRYEPPLEDLPSSAPTTSRSKDDSNKNSRKKSKRKGSVFADVISMISSSGTSANGGDPVGKARSSRGEPLAFESISADKSSEPSEANVTSVEATMDDFDEPKKKNKKSKDRKSSRNDGKGGKSKMDNVIPLDPLDEDESIGRVSESGKSKTRRQSAGDSMTKDSGRITQNIPAEVRPLASIGHELPENLLTDPKGEEVGPSANISIPSIGDIVPVKLYKEPENEAYHLIPFFDSSQELPPLPESPEALDLWQIKANDPVPNSPISLTQVPPRELDLSNFEGKEYPQVFPGTRPISPSPITESQGLKGSELGTKVGTNLEGPTSSPTAVPLKFRLPPPSPGSARSLSSAPQYFSSRDAAITLPNHKSRPRSTEFKSSAEYRPLWLLETNSPRKEPQVEEAYPSLPSSHSSSRSPSIHDHEEYAHELVVKKFDPISSALVIDTSKDVLQPDLLDSQQTTPTAPSYQTGVEEEVTLDRDADTKSGTEESPTVLDLSEPSSLSPLPPSIAQGVDKKVCDLQLDLGPNQYEVLPSLPSSRASSPDAYREPSTEEPRFSSEAHAFNILKEDPSIDSSQSMIPSNGDTKQFDSNTETGEIINMHHDMILSSEVPKASEIQEPSRYLDIFSVREDDENAGDDVEQIEKDSVLAQVLDSSSAIAAGSRNERVKLLTASEQRLIREQDAQDAVDSWSAVPKTSRKDKKDKKKRQKGAPSGSPKVLKPSPEIAIETSNYVSSSGDVIDADKPNEEADVRAPGSESLGSYLAPPTKNSEAGSLYTELTQDEAVPVLADKARETSKDELVDSFPVLPVLQGPGSAAKKSKKSKGKKGKGGRGKSGLQILEEPQVADPITSPRQETTSAQLEPQISPLQGENLEPRTSSILQEISNILRRESPEPLEVIPFSPLGVIQIDKSVNESLDTNLQEQSTEPVDLNIASNHSSQPLVDRLVSDRHISPSGGEEELVSQLEGDKLPLANLIQEQDGEKLFIPEDSLEGDARIFSDDHAVELNVKRDHLQFPHEPSKLVADSQDTESINEVPVEKPLVKTDFRDDFEAIKLPKINDLDLPAPLPDDQDLDLLETLPYSDDLDLLEPLPGDDDLDLLEPLPGDDDLDLLEPLPGHDDLDLLEPLPNGDDPDLLERLPGDDDLDLLKPLPQGDDLDLLEPLPKGDDLDLLETLPEGEDPDLLKPLSGTDDLGLSEPVTTDDDLAPLVPLPKNDDIDLLEPLPDKDVLNLLEPSPRDENLDLEERLPSADDLDVLKPLPPDDDLDILEPLPEGDDLDLLEPVLKSDELRPSEKAPTVGDLDLPAAFRDSPKNEAIATSSAYEKSQAIIPVTTEDRRLGACAISPASILAYQNEPLVSGSSSADVFKSSKMNLEDSLYEPIIIPTSHEKPETIPWEAGDGLENLPALPTSPIIEVITTPSPEDNSMAGSSIAEGHHQLPDEFPKSLAPKSIPAFPNEVGNMPLQATEGIIVPPGLPGSSVEKPLAVPTLFVDPEDKALPASDNLDLNTAFYNNPEAKALPANHDLDLDEALSVNSRAPPLQIMTYLTETEAPTLPTDESNLPQVLRRDFTDEPIPASSFIDDPEDVALPVDSDLDLNETLDIYPKLEPSETVSLQVEALALAAADDPDLPTAMPASFDVEALAVQNTSDKPEVIATYESDPCIDLPGSLDAEPITTAKSQNEIEAPVSSDIQEFATTLPRSFTAKSLESLNPHNEVNPMDFSATDESDTLAPLPESYKAEPVKTANSQREVDAPALPTNEPDLSTALPWSFDAEPLTVQAFEHNPEDIGLPTDDDLDLNEESPASLHSQPICTPRSQDEPEALLSPSAEPLSLQSTLPVPRFRDVPEAIALPPGDDLDLFEGSSETEPVQDITQSISLHANGINFLQRHSPRPAPGFVQDSGHDETTIDPSHLIETPDSNSFASEHLKQEATIPQSPELENPELYPHRPANLSIDQSKTEPVEVRLSQQVGRPPLSAESALVELFESGQIDPRDVAAKVSEVEHIDTGILTTENLKPIKSESESAVAPEIGKVVPYQQEQVLPGATRNEGKYTQVEETHAGKAPVENDQLSQFPTEFSTQRDFESQEQKEKQTEAIEVSDKIPTVMSDALTSKDLIASEDSGLQDTHLSEPIPEADGTAGVASAPGGPLQEDDEYKPKPKKKNGSKRNRRDNLLGSLESMTTPLKQVSTAVQSVLPITGDTTTTVEQNEPLEEIPWGEPGIKLTKNGRKPKKGKRRDMSPEPPPSPKNALSITALETAPLTLDVMSDNEALPLAHQEALDEAPSHVLTKKEKKGKKTKYRDLSPDLAPQSLEPENIPDQIAPESALPITHQEALDEAPNPTLKKKDKKGKKTKYRDLSPDLAPQSLEPEDIPDQIAPGSALQITHQEALDEAPSPTLKKKDRKGKKAKYRDLPSELAPQSLEPEDIFDQTAPESALPITHQEALDEVLSPTLTKKDRKGKKAKYRDLSPDLAPQSLEPGHIPEIALPIIHQIPLDDTPSPALTKKDRKGKKAKYRNLSPELTPQSLELEDIRAQIAPEFALPAVGSVGEDADLSMPDQKAPESALPVLGSISEDADLSMPDQKTPESALPVLSSTDENADLSMPDQKASQSFLPVLGSIGEDADLSMPGQKALKSALPMIGSIGEDADLSMPEPKAFESASPVLGSVGEDADLSIPHEESFKEASNPSLTKKNKKGKKGNNRDLAIDLPASSRKITDILNLSAPESAVPEPALPREELLDEGQNLALTKRNKKGKKYKKRDSSPDFTVPSIESVNFPEPLATETEPPVVTATAEDVDLSLSRDEPLDEAPIPELAKKDKKGKKSRNRDLPSDHTISPRETADILDPSTAEITDPKLSLPQAEMASSPLPPAEPSEKARDQMLAEKTKKGKRSKKRDWLSETYTPHPGVEETDERPASQAMDVEKPTHLEEPTPLKELTALEEPTSFEGLTSLDESTPLEEPTPLKGPTSLKAFTSLEEPISLEESMSLKEFTPFEEPTSLEELTPFEESTSLKGLTPLEEPTPLEALTPLKELTSSEALKPRLLEESTPLETSRSSDTKDFDDQTSLKESASLEKLTPLDESTALEQSASLKRSAFSNQPTSKKPAFVEEPTPSEGSVPLKDSISFKKPTLLKELTPFEESKFLAEPTTSNMLKPLEFSETLQSTDFEEPLPLEEPAPLQKTILLEQPESMEKSNLFKEQIVLKDSASEAVLKPFRVPLPLESSLKKKASSGEPRFLEERASSENSMNLDKSSPLEQSTFIEERTPFEESKPPPPESFFNRDSAIHVSDSPLLPDKVPIYHAPRDSGYQETDASTVANVESMAAERRDTFSQDSTTRLGERHVEEQNDRQFLHPPAPETHWDIPVELDPDHAMSVPATALGFIDVNDEQRSPSNALPLITQEAILPSTEQPCEPSPVDSTTKDRSSVLFQSSPSSRDVCLDQPSIHHSPPHDQITGDQARPDSWTLPQWSPADLSTADVLIGSDVAIPAPEILENTSETAPDAGLSLFGSVVDSNDELQSPSRSPFTSSNAKQHRLDTITEYSPEESPLQRKRPAISATGSPEPKLSSRRYSISSASNRRQYAHPPSNTEVVGNFISTDDIISRLSWPSVDDESHLVDLERSQSRNNDKMLTGRASNTSTPGAGLIKNREYDHRSVSGASVGSVDSITAIIRTPDQARSVSGLSQRSSGTPPLRRTDRSVSGDLRLANKRGSAKPLAKTIEAETDVEIEAGVNEELEADGEGAVSTTLTALPAPITISVPSSSTYDPARDKGKSRLTDMTDVYEGWGDVRGASPMSPTRPPSMRRRQSMQVMELETKVDQLVSENRLLQDAKLRAQTGLDKAEHRHDALTEAIRTRDRFLTQKDSELTELRQILEGLQSQVSRLTEVNQELIVTKANLDQHHGQKYAELEAQHADTYEQRQQATRELDDLRQQHTQLSAAMEEIVRHEISVAVEGKNVELRKLRDELEGAKEQVRILQQQILASRKSEDLIVDRDVDYFDVQCQNLCGRVQQWVLRFSKFSDGRACYLASEVRNEKMVDRFENAMLDGSDVDSYLQDRVKRRDVFMSVVMTMVSEYIFTRYLFGLDREHRSKLKALEKTLAEAGPMKAVHKWRATTLTLLTNRDSFRAQRAQDTEAVALEIYETLATFLPPPAHLVRQTQESLRNVVSSAVDLSIEMRTQRTQYMMLPTLTPEYDTNGDLACKVYFNASLMNERSGTTSSNEGLEAQQAVVRIVLFPLVVKKGDDSGIGDEEIVVCPAQVLTVPGAKDKDVARVQARAAEQSAVSLGGSDLGMGGMI